MAEIINKNSSSEQVNYWDKVLDEYEASIGLSTYNANTFCHPQFATTLCKIVPS